MSLQWFNELLNYWLTIWLYSNILLLQHTPSNYAGVTQTWPTVMDKGTPIVANIIAPLRPRKHPQSHYHVTIKSIVKYVLRKRLIYCSLWMVPCTRNISQCFIASDVAYLLLLLITSTTSKRVTYCYVTFHICIWQQTYGYKCVSAELIWLRLVTWLVAFVQILTDSFQANWQLLNTNTNLLAICTVFPLGVF